MVIDGQNFDALVIDDLQNSKTTHLVIDGKLFDALVYGDSGKFETSPRGNGGAIDCKRFDALVYGDTGECRRSLRSRGGSSADAQSTRAARQALSEAMIANSSDF